MKVFITLDSVVELIAGMALICAGWELLHPVVTIIIGGLLIGYAIFSIGRY